MISDLYCHLLSNNRVGMFATSDLLPIATCRSFGTLFALAPLVLFAAAAVLGDGATICAANGAARYVFYGHLMKRCYP